MPLIAKEIKEEILGKIKQGEKVVALSKQYGINEKTIYYWLRSSTQDHVSLMEHSRLKRENQELKAIIGALTIEVERLKKKRR